MREEPRLHCVFSLFLFVCTLTGDHASYLKFSFSFFKDVAKINEGKQPLYQDDTNKRILNSMELLNSLDDDAIEAKNLQHPQAEMIGQEWVIFYCSWGLSST